MEPWRTSTTLLDLLSWRVVLDVSLLASALFFLYRTLRTTSSWKMVLGVLSAAVAYAGAIFLDLRGIEWIFSNLSQVALIALLVVFQPEIRRLLERAPLLWRRPTQADEGDLLPHLLDEALFALAGRKWGALVVLPGKDPILQRVTEGIPSDATPSVPLVLSIFDPDSPGHDGGMVIENGRISRFAVRLPLSQSGSLPPDLGTRHNAAMGLSETSDALVLAVSEERGVISAFHEGTMSPLRAPGEVAARVQRHLAVAQASPLELLRTRRRWVAALEFGACLMFAFVFSSTVVSSHTETREMFYTVPIEYTRTPRDLVLVSERPTQARLHLAGPISTLTHLDLSGLRVEVDLSAAGTGRQTLPLTDHNVRMPRKLQLLEIEPPALDVELRAVREVDLPIQAQLIGELPPGLRIAEVQTDPETFRALVPDGEFTSQTVWTTPIYLSNLRQSTRIFTKIVVPPGIQSADRRWPDVEVRVTLERAGE